MTGGEQQSYEFGPFRLDVGERQLLKAGVPLPLTPKAFEVLTVLVTRAGHLVEKEELLNLVWKDAFVEEINIARAVHTLRKALGEDGGQHKFIETVAKRGYRFVGEVIRIEPQETNSGNADRKAVARFPVALPKHKVTKSGLHAIVDLAEWRAVEAHAEKHEEPLNLVREEPEIDEPYTPSQPQGVRRTGSSRRGVAAALFAAVVVVLVALGYYLPSRQAVTPGKKSIAILPFRPLDSSDRNVYYELGMTDAVINQLAGVNDLIVRPLYATQKYADIEHNPIAAGKEQLADYVLAANYQLADGRIRITAQLFNVASGEIEETFKTEKDAGDIFAVQDTIAGVLAKRLLARFALNQSKTVAGRGTTNEEAYRLYLQGRNLTMRRSGEAHKKAIEYFEQAIKIDPNYALAYARMAHAYWAVAIADKSTDAEKAKGFVKKALELDPNLAEALATRGYIGLAYDWDYKAAERDFLRAIELEPNNDTAHWLYSLLLTNRGLFDEGLREMEAAQAIDPGAVLYMSHRGRILYYARRYDEAIAQYQQAIDLDDRFQPTYSWMVRIYETNGDYETAFRFFLKQEERSPRKNQLEHYQKVYATSGWAGVRQVADTNGRLFDLARLHALRGEKDAAFENLNKAVEERHWLMTTLNVEPAFDNLRDDPRFDELVKRVGLK